MADSDDSKKKDSATQRGLKSFGKAMRDTGQKMSEQAQAQAAARADEPSPNSQPRYVDVDSYKRGGKVRRTGKARLHKGEVLVRKGRKRGRKMSGRM